MKPSPAPSPEYEARLAKILSEGDVEGLREFVREQNSVPDDIYQKDRHFWEVLLHKLVCNRLDTLAFHETSRAWLEAHGYTTDLGGY